MIMAKLSLEAALATSGSVPENVNYALKSSLLLAFLESVPSLVGRLKPPPTTLKTMQQVAAELEEATALILALLGYRPVGLLAVAFAAAENTGFKNSAPAGRQ